MAEPTTNTGVDTSDAAITTQRRLRVGALTVVVLAVLGWWAWPTITGADDTAPVVVVITPAFDGVNDRFEGELRTRGRAAQVVVAREGWCQVVEAGRDLDASLRVVVADPEPGCDPWESSGESGSWWWIAPSGVGDEVVVPSNVSVLDLGWTLGDAGTLRRGCEWWDDCEPDGQITLRSEPGVLTPAGLERVARVVAVLR
jgi:hypothetical protein